MEKITTNNTGACKNPLRRLRTKRSQPETRKSVFQNYRANKDTEFPTMVAGNL